MDGGTLQFKGNNNNYAKFEYDWRMGERYNLRVTTTMSTLTKPLPTLDYKLT